MKDYHGVWHGEDYRGRIIDLVFKTKYHFERDGWVNDADDAFDDSSDDS